MTPALVKGVQRAYGLDLTTAVDLGGSVNLNLLARDERGRFVVRAYRSSVLELRLRSIQRARAHLAAHGVPCAIPVRGADGSKYIRVDEVHLVEVEPFVEADAKMDALERIAAGLPTLGRVHDLLADADLLAAARGPAFANYVDPVVLVDATRNGTDRIRSWGPTAEEAAIAEAADRLALWAAEAQAPFSGLRPQIVHGDFWDNNVLFRGDELVLVGDFDFMDERPRIDDLALTLFFTTFLFDDPLGPTAWEHLAALVDGYDAGTTRPLSTTERAALPVALARQPLWSIAVWAALLDDEATARRHIRGHLPALEQGLAILAALESYQQLVS